MSANLPAALEGSCTLLEVKAAKNGACAETLTNGQHGLLEALLFLLNGIIREKAELPFAERGPGITGGYAETADEQSRMNNGIKLFKEGSSDI